MKIRRRRQSFITIFFIAGLLSSAGHIQAAPNPVQWSVVSVPHKPLTTGASFTLELLSRIDPGWHLYALDQEEGGPIATEIGLPENSFLSLESIHSPKPIHLLDPNFNHRVSIYVEKAQFRLAMTVGPDSPTGTQHSSIQIRYQCCDATMCLPPRRTTLDFSLSIKARR